MTGKVIDVIGRALRLVGAIDARKTPSGREAELCLSELGDLIPSLPGWTEWTDVEIHRDWAPLGEDYRIAIIGNVEVDITLPQLVFDAVELGCGEDGAPVECGDIMRAPRDGARLRAYSQVSGEAVYYAYRADTGQWVKVIGLGLSDDVPVSGDMHGHLAALLAERIAPVFGLPLSGEAGRFASLGRLAWAARYDRRKPAATPAGEAASIGNFM